ncbi:glycoside hydrolase N-terminal domain-containing protein [uncultured Bacteroides sp.]|uniref:glycoside hydrolase N-terminal domain-containing protein n=1 Tax=uncultured Bacteroides sp. TaxID=162156 RepID=UPI0025E4E32A|nr:glycoside hydrolase N-terminal domain-containing protein [uncultured Bacteroides sp.]
MAMWTRWSKSPAQQWEDAFVTGNGKTGSLIVGRSQEERITCVHEELFIRGWDRHKVTVPYTAPLMPYVRQLMAEGKSDEAARMLTDEADRQLRAMGANQRWPLIPHPAFVLCIRPLEKSSLPVTDYRRNLNLETGEATVAWKQEAGSFTESVFSSRKDNVNVIRLKATKSAKINVELSLEETPGRKGEHFEYDLEHAFSEVNREAFGHWLTYHAAYDKDFGGYDGVAKVTLKGGSIQAKGKSLVVRNAEEVLIVVSIVSQEDVRNASLDAIKAGLDKLAVNYDKLLRPHAQKHGELFRCMQLDLGCGEQWAVTPTEQLLTQIKKTGITPLFLEQLHAVGRYLLISSCGKFPPPLQGIWSGGWNPAWIGGFVWDSNLNLAISATTMSNLPECTESYNRHIETLLPGWRLNDRNYLGCRGFIVAHYNDPRHL